MLMWGRIAVIGFVVPGTLGVKGESLVLENGCFSAVGAVLL